MKEAEQYFSVVFLFFFFLVLAYFFNIIFIVFLLFLSYDYVLQDMASGATSVRLQRVGRTMLPTTMW